MSRATGSRCVKRSLITKQNPSDQVSATPAPSQDEHPFATNDEKYIYFDTDRADATSIPQVSTGIFNIYRMNIDGSVSSRSPPGAPIKSSRPFRRMEAA